MARELSALSTTIRNALVADPTISNTVLAQRLGCDPVKVSIQRQALKRKTAGPSSDEEVPTVLTKRQAALADLHVLKRLARQYSPEELTELIDLVR